MITIDFGQYIKDRMWFGYYYENSGIISIHTHSRRVKNTNWRRSEWWTLRCWPCLRDGNIVPGWWVDFFVRVGLVPPGDGDPF